VRWVHQLVGWLDDESGVTVVGTFRIDRDSGMSNDSGRRLILYLSLMVIPKPPDSPPVVDARRRLAAAGLSEHIGDVEIADRDGQPTLIVEVRAELRPVLTSRVLEALSPTVFRIRDTRIADGAFYGSGTDDGEFVVSGAAAKVVVEPMLDHRPVLIQELHSRLRSAGLEGNGTQPVGSVRVHRTNGEDRLEIGISANTPRELEPQIRKALGDLPVERLHWREPHR
jgi:hypothetical protein